jgi:hypothetical protein
LVPGNHDYDNMYHTSGTISYYPPLVATPDWWKNYFGSNSKYFRGKSWYVGASDDVGYISAGSTAGKSATIRASIPRPAHLATMGCPARRSSRQAARSSFTSPWRWRPATPP